jgi:hypothetical protein
MKTGEGELASGNAPQWLAMVENASNFAGCVELSFLCGYFAYHRHFQPG